MRSLQLRRIVAYKVDKHVRVLAYVCVYICVHARIGRCAPQTEGIRGVVDSEEKVTGGDICRARRMYTPHTTRQIINNVPSAARAQDGSEKRALARRVSAFVLRVNSIRRWSKVFLDPVKLKLALQTALRSPDVNAPRARALTLSRSNQSRRCGCPGESYNFLTLTLFPRSLYVCVPFHIPV